jgi:hypothetical protein
MTGDNIPRRPPKGFLATFDTTPTHGHMVAAVRHTDERRIQLARMSPGDPHIGSPVPCANTVQSRTITPNHCGIGLSDGLPTQQRLTYSLSVHLV